MPVSVLICDDSSMARKQLARVLPADLDIIVEFAANGQEALDQIRLGKGEVLFLDLNMPVMDGYETLAEIQRAHLSSSVIVVSGDIQPEARRRVIELGARDFIKKPVSAGQLAEIIIKYGLRKNYEGQNNINLSTQREVSAIRVEEWDVYRELANVAMGRAASLLARKLGVFVKMPIPTVNLIEIGELRMALHSTEQASVSAVCQGFIGAQIAGEALLLFHDSSFRDIARLMRYRGTLNPSVELELLMDVGNILIGAWLKGLAEQLDISFSQGHPIILGQHCLVSDLFNTNAARWKKLLAVDITYTVENHQIDCDLLILFSEDSFVALRKKASYLF
ncbi:chemotaxis protein CheC [Gammaproteobacteria bacterium]